MGVCVPSQRRHCRPTRRLRRFAAVPLLVAVTCLCLNAIHGFSVGRPVVRGSNHRPREVISDAAGDVPLDGTFCKRQPPSPSAVLRAKRRPDDANENDDGDGDVLGVFKRSPGAAVAAPFVLLIGLDLVLNVLAVTRRSLEVLFTGEYTVWAPWQ